MAGVSKVHYAETRKNLQDLKSKALKAWQALHFGDIYGIPYTSLIGVFSMPFFNVFCNSP